MTLKVKAQHTAVTQSFSFRADARAFSVLSLPSGRAGAGWSLSCLPAGPLFFCRRFPSSGYSAGEATRGNSNDF